MRVFASTKSGSKGFAWGAMMLLLLIGSVAIAQDPLTTTDEFQAQSPQRSRVRIAQCSKNVGMLGNYFAGAMTTFLQNNGHTVFTVDQAFINGGGLNTLNVLYFNRGGTGVANANVAAITAFVQGGGILITEFSATVAVIDNFNLCTAGTLDVTFGVPSGTVCGGNTITVQNPSNPVATGLGGGWSCSGDPIGVFKVYSNLDPNFDIVATVNADQNNDGLDDPVVATCCVGAGVWVAYFTDFGDWTALQNPRICPFPNCSRSVEDETLMINSVCLALESCCTPVEDPDVRTQGFWKRVCAGPHPSGEHENLPSYVDCVNSTATFADVANARDLCDRLTPNPRNDKCEQAEAQFMALLLNVCSGRIELCNCIDDPVLGAVTVGDAIAFIDGLLSNPFRTARGRRSSVGRRATFEDCVLAQAIASAINEGLTLVDCQ